MSESIAEMVLPGTYIEVRSEGLIGTGPIATGNIGIVGSAARGPKGAVRSLGSMAEARELFGPPGSLTLVRGLEQAFAGGASSVYAVRAANGTPARASLKVMTSDTPAKEAFTLSAGLSDSAVLPDPDAGSWGNDISVAVEADGTAWKLTVTLGSTKEVFTGADVAAVRVALVESALVRAGAVVNGAAGGFAIVTAAPGTNLTGGTDGTAPNSPDIGDALTALEDQPVNIVVVPGLGAKAVAAVVATHLERTENEGRERVALLGVTSPGTATNTADPVDEAGGISNARIVLVAPGLVVTDRATGKATKVGASYLACMVAGKLATVAPHVSLTNKTVPAEDLDVAYPSTAAKNLLLKGILVVRRRFGFQVVKAITTDSGAFRQISIRRTVDYAKAGVRSGSDPYIGKLNNARVRGALKATLDGFLSQMILDEMLVAYELDVSATRAQEINGICSVTMTLLPTFSIDYIRVTINLQ